MFHRARIYRFRVNRVVVHLDIYYESSKSRGPVTRFAYCDIKKTEEERNTEELTHSNSNSRRKFGALFALMSTRC